MTLPTTREHHACEGFQAEAAAPHGSDLCRQARQAEAPVMMTAKQYRARADLMDDALQASSNGTVIAECHRMARDWRKLADLADWQDAMREKGHLPY